MKTHLRIAAMLAMAVVLAGGVGTAPGYVYGYDPAKNQGGGLYMELAQDPTLIFGGIYDGKYEYFFDLYTTGGTMYYNCILGLDNSKIANAQTITPDLDHFKTQEYGDPDGYPNRAAWADTTGRILDFWSKDVNASLPAATVPDMWRTSYDDGVGGWTDTGLGYPGSSTLNPHSYGEYVEYSGFGEDVWKAELMTPGGALQWQLFDPFGDIPTQDVILIMGTNWWWTTHGNGGVFATVRVVYDEVIDPANISWGSASGGSTPIMGDFTVVVPPVTPGDFDDDGDVDADDVQALCDNMGGALTYDVDEDGDVDQDDLILLIETLVEWDNGVDTGVGTKQGDFNLDGVVNATDLAIMKGTFGASGVAYADGNANCDTVVNATDLAILKGTFGFVAPTGGGVPEPATLFVMAAAGLPLLLKRKRKSRA